MEKWGGEALVSPKASLTPPALCHCCLPEQCQQSLPGPQGHLGIMPVLQDMWGQGCHKPSPSAPTSQPRDRAALWLERLLNTRDASFCYSPISSSPPQASTADHCQAQGNSVTLFPTKPLKPLEMLLLFMKIGSGSCCQLLPEL